MPIEDFDAVYVKHPVRAARTRAHYLRRALVLECRPGHDPRQVEECRSTAERYEKALRAKGLCILCGTPLERDDLAKWRGIGSTCWAKLTPDERAEATAAAEAINGPRTAPATTVAEAEADLARALGFVRPEDRF